MEGFDYRTRCQTRIRPPQDLRNVGMRFGESLYVELINQRLVPGNTRWRVSPPSKGGVDDSVLRHPGGVVTPIKGQVFIFVSDPVSKVGVAPTDSPLNLLAVGVKKKFVVIKTMALRRRIWAIDPVSVQLSRTDLWQIAVPDHISLLGKPDAKRFTFPRNVKKTEFHFLPVL